jgi:hypothetical protein
MAQIVPDPSARVIPYPPLQAVGRVLLLIGFAFAVMADPVSSVAYTIEASLRALHGHLSLLLATQVIVLAFPVAMALATGTEAPATAMAQLGQIGSADRRRFARTTLVLTLVIVSGLTIGLTELAVRLHVGIPKADSTQIADIAHTAAGNGAIYAIFQAVSALLLLAAASSSFQAGPGLLKALSRHPHSAGVGILPRSLGEANRHHTPYWSVVVYVLVSAGVLVAAAGREQDLVLFYAVAVFVSFLAGLAAMTRFSLRDRRRGLATVNVLGALSVTFTLIVNLGRGYPLLSLAATALIAVGLYALWRRAGCPSGIEEAERLAEAGECRWIYPGARPARHSQAVNIRSADSAIDARALVNASASVSKPEAPSAAFADAA